MVQFQKSLDVQKMPYSYISSRLALLKDGIKLVVDNLFDFKVSHYSSEQLTKAMHTNELNEDNATHIRIDYKVSGIGSKSCGPELLGNTG